MGSFILGMTTAIEEAAADPAISDELKEWILEKCVPALCAEVRRLAGLAPESKPAARSVVHEEPVPVQVARPVVHDEPKPVHDGPPSVHEETPRFRVRRDPLKQVTQLASDDKNAHVPGLKREMARAGLTHALLASKLGVSAASIDNWRAGRVRAGADRLPEIAAALGCTVQQLVTP